MAVDVSTLAIQVTSSGIKDASRELGGLNTSATNAEKKVNRLTESLSKLMNVQATATGKAMAQANALAGNIDSTSVLAAATTKLSQSMLVLSESFSNNAVKAGRSTAAIGRHTAAMKDAHAMARGLSGSLGALWVTYGNMVPLAAGLAIGAGFKSVISVGKEVEHTLEAIRVRGEESAESINKMREAVLELGRGVYAPTQVAEAFQTLILAGLNAKQSLESVNDALNLAVTGGTSIEKAAYTLVQVGTALGYTTQGFSAVGDTIAKTAAVSMSSVESLSEAFKQASSVGKLYGVSLNDIAVQLAALSNLGIQGSAAGTAIKNFYKELSSDAKKIQDTFKVIKLPQLDLRDKAGNFKPILEVVEKLSKSLERLNGVDQMIAKQRLSNERGLRDLIPLLELYGKKTADGSNELQKLFDRVADHAGYSASKAIMLSMTAQSQIQSVWNSLKSTFAETFKSIEPQVSLIARSFRTAFGSDEFKKGLLGITSALSAMFLTIAENLPLITALIAGLVGLKVINTLISGFTALGGAIATAFGALTAGAGVAATIAGVMTGLGIVVAAGTAAWMAYSYWKNKSLGSDQAAAAKASTDEMTEKLQKDIQQTKEATDLRIKGLSIGEAALQQGNNVILQKAKENEQWRIGNKLQEVNNALMKVDPVLLGKYQKNPEAVTRQLEFGGMQGTLKGLQKATTAQKEYEAEVVASQKRLDNVEKLVKQHASEYRRKENVELEILKKNQKEVADGAKSVFGGTDNKIGMKDAWRSELVDIQGEIDRAKRDYARTELELQSQERSGVISKLEMIERISVAEASMFQKEIDGYNRQITQASTAANKQAVAAEYRNKLQAASEGLINATVKMEQQAAVEIAAIEKSITQDKIEEYKKRGEIVAAAQIQNDETFAKEIKALEQQAGRMRDEMESLWSNGGDISKTANNLEIVLKKIESIKSKSRSFLADAGIKEASQEFETLFKQLQADVESVNEKATEGGGWLARFVSQEEIDAIVNNRLPALTAAIEKARQAAEADGASAETQEKYATQLRNYERYMKSQGKVYREFIDEVDKIGMQGFESLFSDVNGSWKDCVKDMRSSFKKLLVDEVYKAFARPFILNIVGNVAGATGANGLASAAMSAAGNGNGLMGLLQNGSSIYDGLSKASGWLGLGGAAMGVTGATGITAGTAAATGVAGAISGAAGGGITGATLGGAGLGFAPGVVGTTAITGTAGAITGAGGTVAAGTAAGTAAGATATTGIMGGISSALAAIPVWGWILLAIIAFKDKLFGHKLVGAGLEGAIKGDQFTGNSYEFKKGGLFRGDKTERTPLDEKASSGFNSVIKSMYGSFENLGQTIGAGSDRLKGFNYQFRLALKDFSDEDKPKVVQTALARMSDSMAMAFVDTFRTSVDLAKQQASTFYTNTIDGESSRPIGATGFASQTRAATPLDPYIDDIIRIFDAQRDSFAGVEGAEGKLTEFTSKLFLMADGFVKNEGYIKTFGEALNFAKLESVAVAGETVLDTFNRLNSIFAATAGVAMILGQDVDKAFGVVGLASLEARQRLIDLAGGMDALAAGTSFFYENFLTSAEKLDIVSARVKPVLSGLGFENVSTVEQFAAMVKSFDLGTQKGAEAYATALKVQQDFLTMVGLSTASANEALNTAKTRESEIEAARNVLSEAYERESNALKDTISKFKEFGKSLRDFRDSLLIGSLTNLSPEQKYLELKSRFNTTSALAATGDETALGQLQGISEQFLEASKDYFASSMGYTTDFELVRTALEQAANAADIEVTLAEKQLAYLNQSVAGILAIDKSVISVKEALDKYFAVGGTKDPTAMPGGGGSITYGAGGAIDYAATYGGGGSMPASGINAAAEAYGNQHGNDAYYIVPGVNDYQSALQNAQAYIDRIAYLSEKEGIAVPDGHKTVDDYFQMTKGMSAAAWQQVETDFFEGNAPVDGSHADGLNYVPFNGYRAELHKGERVQTASQAKDSDETAELMRQVLMELKAQTAQGGAAAEMTIERLEKVADKLDSTNRKLAANAAN